ncbi:MAG: alanine racemase [Sandaracinaceae bacterium]
MGLEYTDFSRILTGEPLPSALVDLDAVARNAQRILEPVRGRDKTLRLASKSVRHVGLLRRILALDPRIRGLMCYATTEAAFLSAQGFDDLLVAYPSVDRHGLDAVARCVADGATIRLMADAPEHLEAYDAAAERAHTRLEVLLELDVSYRPIERVALGVLRSPLFDPDAVGALAREAASSKHVRVVGLMGYEAHVAGLPDDTPFGRWMNPARRALKRLSIPQIAERRAAAVDALRAAGVEVAVVNGGGTGSVASTAQEACVTEVTAGSGFLCPHLFDYYAASSLEPAAYFALEVSRIPTRGVVTCLGGGYVASGEAGPDRLPLPWRPRELAYVSMEGAGEVQTPLRVRGEASALRIGSPVIFRHAKAGELAERFDSYLLVEGGESAGREPTYRGQGRCFL